MISQDDFNRIWFIYNKFNQITIGELNYLQMIMEKDITLVLPYMKKEEDKIKKKWINLAKLFITLKDQKENGQ